MAARKPKIEYYWSPQYVGLALHHRVNWRLVGANGEIMCQSTQGFRDKTDAQRSVSSVIGALLGANAAMSVGVREVGPGRKPS